MTAHPDVGPQQPVDDEALGVAAGDRVLADVLAEGHQLGVGVLGGVLGPHDLRPAANHRSVLSLYQPITAHLHQPHHRHGVEEVEAAAPVLAPNLRHHVTHLGSNLLSRSLRYPYPLGNLVRLNAHLL